MLESQRKQDKSAGLSKIADTLEKSTIDSGDCGIKDRKELDEQVENKGCETNGENKDKKKKVNFSTDDENDDSNDKKEENSNGAKDDADGDKSNDNNDEYHNNDEFRRNMITAQLGQPPEAADGKHATSSRLLTKKQLSDMAWGVRELSKRLGSIRLKLKVRTVFLLTKAHDESLIENTREVAKWLLSEDRAVRYIVYVEENLKDHKKFNAKGLLEDLERQKQKKKEQNPDSDGDQVPSGASTPNGKKERRLRYWNNEMCRNRPHTFDFAVTLGGDGTVLYASWLFQRIMPPVLSFALGSLGFLTKFDYGNFEETLTKSFRDGVTVSLRLRFEGTVMRSQKRGTKPKKNGENDLHGKLSEEPEPRDLVEELIGEEQDDDMTHRPDGSYEILNDIVVDRGPNPSMLSQPSLDDPH